MSKLRICLDPGHGGRDPGTVAGNLRESDLVLEIAKSVQTLLEPKCELTLTRKDDVTVSLAERVRLADVAGAEISVSIHVNSATNSQASGYEIFVRPTPLPESLLLASAILVQFSKRWPDKRNRGLKQANLFVTKQQRPATLVECFFLSNPTDRALLNSSQERLRIAEAVAWGCGNLASSRSDRNTE